MLIVEAGLIDKYSHNLDWERAVYDTIMLDDAVQVAKDFAANHNDTLIIVVPDHAHPISLVGTYDDAKGATLREKLQTYAAAKFPDYAAPNAEGYPPSVDVARRLALVFAAYPDFCDAASPTSRGRSTSARHLRTRSIARPARRYGSEIFRLRRVLACTRATTSC